MINQSEKETQDEMPVELQGIIKICESDKRLWERVRALSGLKADVVFLCNGGIVIRAIVQERP